MQGPVVFGSGGSEISHITWWHLASSYFPSVLSIDFSHLCVHLNSELQEFLSNVATLAANPS